ncbi:unnamed protein product [[Candida] boidinii]|nr:hypothetical protein B5S33_g434 [[Candida] boidinii]GMF04116.1 unnamed protein product [[Candida] boidinii]
MSLTQDSSSNIPPPTAAPILSHRCSQPECNTNPPPPDESPLEKMVNFQTCIHRSKTSNYKNAIEAQNRRRLSDEGVVIVDPSKENADEIRRLAAENKTFTQMQPQWFKRRASSYSKDEPSPTASTTSTTATKTATNSSANIPSIHTDLVSDDTSDKTSAGNHQLHYNNNHNHSNHNNSNNNTLSPTSMEFSTSHKNDSNSDAASTVSTMVSNSYTAGESKFPSLSKYKEHLIDLHHKKDHNNHHHLKSSHGIDEEKSGKEKSPLSSKLKDLHLSANKDLHDFGKKIESEFHRLNDRFQDASSSNSSTPMSKSENDSKNATGNTEPTFIQSADRRKSFNFNDYKNDMLKKSIGGSGSK